MRTEYRDMLRPLFNRPDGQLALLLMLALMLLTAGGYGLGLLGIVASAKSLETQIAEQHQQIAQRQRLLLRQPSRREWQVELALIATPAVSLSQLSQRILAPLNAASGRLLHWQPEQKQAVDDAQQRGTFRLQLPYGGLELLLQTLLFTSPTPVAIEQLSLSKNQTSASLLEVTLRLATYPGSVSDALTQQAKRDIASPLLRDPFQASAHQRCDEAYDTQELPQLKGVIGTAERLVGWLVTPGGTWLKAQRGEMLAAGNGRVESVSPQQVTISASTKLCGERHYTLILERPE